MKCQYKLETILIQSLIIRKQNKNLTPLLVIIPQCVAVPILEISIQQPTSALTSIIELVFILKLNNDSTIILMNNIRQYC